MLFNIKDDPYELYNIYDTETTIAAVMLADLAAAADSITETKALFKNPEIISALRLCVRRVQY